MINFLSLPVTIPEMEVCTIYGIIGTDANPICIADCAEV